MSLFVCAHCEGIENTALSNYWIRQGKSPLCSECDPKIKKWHDSFPKQYFSDDEWEYYDGDFIQRKDK